VQFPASQGMIWAMRGRYRELGADGPFGDPRRGHGVAMEGYFWRFTDAAGGRVVVALCGVCRSPAGRWATVALGDHPGGALAEADVAPAAVDPARLGVRAGPFVAGPDTVAVDLGPHARLEARLGDVVGWPARRPLGGSGAAHLIPGLGQYWHPHALGGRAEGRAILDGREIDLTGWDVYAEKNWGGAFPDRWWWGEAQGFERRDVAVAFAGGPVALGPVRFAATAVVVRLGDQVLRLGDPLLSPVRASVGDGRWSLAGRGPLWSVEIEAAGPPAAAHILPVPLPAERRSVPGALEHLAGRLRLVVRRRGRVVFAGESRLAGLEDGGGDRAAAELARRGGRSPVIADHHPDSDPLEVAT
jgi:hypothetical protein